MDRNRRVGFRAAAAAAAMASALVLLAACSLTLPVKGQLESGKETFTGTATGYMDRSGDLTVTTSSGTLCSGTFVYTTPRKGEGVFNCDDGRSGPFTFVSTGHRGTGTGHLGDDKFTFTFGS
ncbi:hypothetical protein SAMN06265365_14230 [Tistlia consotensis]|uniref:Lipoprotein n=1 Tax=Tistlia consotensis USBA 355 TaxID=560819 RepID=A0A1Y6CPP9_9PROT|nr:hypothetical protein [Tistlia consotensis]SMF82113.1 hypothetical protein SAMN05428998_14530 [Tistlia consotensis USBA 355]SNS25500.1 hypothetical protein SAMN06265365_14230 [Tistlia consotensis]